MLQPAGALWLKTSPVGVVNGSSDAGMKAVSMKSSAEMILNLLGGHVDVAFNAGSHIPYLESGELKMIATVKEQGFDIYVDPYFYIAGPAGMPAETKAALADALAAAVASDTVRDAIANAMHTDPSDLGMDETKAILVNGLANAAILFGKK